MNFITVDKTGGNTFLPIIFGKFLLIWIIRVKSAKITFMLYCYGEYSMAINVIHKGSHILGANISVWEKENLGIIQLAISQIGSQKSMWTWNAVPGFLSTLFYLSCIFFFSYNLYYCVTHWSLNNSHLGFLDTDTRWVEKQEKNLCLLFFLCSLSRGFVKAVQALK